MKKVTSIFAVFLMALTVTACSNNSESELPSYSTVDSQGGSSTSSSTSQQTASSNSEGQESSSESSTAGSDTPSESSSESDKILVAYFSRVGNTDWDNDVDAVTSASLNLENENFVGNAEYLARMAQQASGGDLFLIQTANTYPSAYRDTTDAAKVEQNNNSRPELSSHVENMEDYDTIILIYPNWWGTLPQALFTFLEEYDFSGKTILPLCTHEGSGMGRSEGDISSLCPNAELLDGLAVRGSSASSAQSQVESWIRDSGILD